MRSVDLSRSSRGPVPLASCSGSTAFGVLICLTLLAWPAVDLTAEELSQAEAAAALHRACEFLHREVSTSGGYLWRYSADLAKREGEGKADAATVWVQPPGTPSIGLAILDVYELTGDEYYLNVAKDAGYCLVQGQLISGGWDYRIDFDPKRRERYAYRQSESPGPRNTTTLDDNTTQEALRLLMRLDQTLKFKDQQIHDAAMYGLEKLMEAQYPNGAWPQRFVEPPDPAAFPVLKANYPEDWSRVFPSQKYSHYYTFNDNSIADTIDVAFQAARTYNDDRYRDAAKRAGDFILLAQMPEPQPGWAQQYNPDMQPAWARKFEPASITGGEAGGVIRALLAIYRETGDAKYLAPIPRALEYYRSCTLDNGQLARFYELKANRPLYFTKDYKLTYDDSDMPTHYAFKVSNWVESVSRQYEQVRELAPEALAPRRVTGPPKLSSSLQKNAAKIVQAMDGRGAWVEEGPLKYHGDDDDTRQVIDCRTVINNLRRLALYVAATK